MRTKGSTVSSFRFASFVTVNLLVMPHHLYSPCHPVGVAHSRPLACGLAWPYIHHLPCAFFATPYSQRGGSPHLTDRSLSSGASAMEA